MKRSIVKVVKIVIIVYCLLGIALFYLQEKFLFHPEPVASDFKYHFKEKTEEVFIPVNRYEQIHFVKFFADTPSRGLVLYFHGNMKNIAHYERNVAFFTSRGFDVWMPDYPGFGKTTGQLTEERMYNHAIQVRKMAEEQFSPHEIIVYGRSLGSGIAAYVAANSANASLVLETPYSSIPSLFSTYAFIYPVNRMSNFKIPTKEYLKDVKEPVLIMHGTRDRTIPMREALKLKTRLKAGDRFVEIEGGKHNDLNSKELYLETLHRWMIRE